MVNFLDALKMIHVAGIVEQYALLMLVVYLTDVWGLGITHAAGLINIWGGLTKLMPLVFLFLMDHYIGTYSLLIISTATSSLGMGLLSISTPSWLYSLVTGSCSEYKKECIGETRQSMFYVALILIMIGISSRMAAMITLNFKGNANEQELMKRLVTSWTDLVNMQASLLVMSPWSVMFGISSVCNSLAVYLLMGKSWSHKLYINKPERSLVTSVLRVFVASISKISLDLSNESTSFNPEINVDDSPLRRSSSLRFLEKAAIRHPNDKGRKKRWMVCSLQEVEDAKTLVRMLPVGVMVTFLALISSICNTYFLQQAKRMRPAGIFGLEIVTVKYLVLVYSSMKVSSLQERIKNLTYNNTQENKEMLRSGVLDTTVYAISYCVIAALVEKSRLGVITRHGLANKPDEIIPMSMSWLLPQICILACFDASLDRILCIFFMEDMPLRMINFKIFVLEGFVGVGIISGVLVVYLVGKISEMGGRPSWFQHDTENSRLDLFYWTLSVICFVVSTIWFNVPRYFNNRRHHNLQTST